MQAATKKKLKHFGIGLAVYWVFSLIWGATAPASAHPFNAPQLGDLQGFYYDGAAATGSVVASARYVGPSSASFSLRVGDAYSESVRINDEYTTVIINGHTVEPDNEGKAIGSVLVEPGDTFSILHKNGTGAGVYQLWTSFLSDDTEPALLAQWDALYDAEAVARQERGSHGGLSITTTVTVTLP